MMNNDHLSKKLEYETPQELYDKLNSEFGFTLDPCSNMKTPNAKNIIPSMKMD